ncbi:MAG TPA: alpha/beta hydrolase, partial [Tepidisphaeraceae bacterium]|nr:alpha/beta hydrolase [Tepidisphaeraceae bacterium]
SDLIGLHFRYKLMLSVCTIALGLGMVGAVAAFAANSERSMPIDGQVIRLWQGQAPEAKGDSPGDVPTLTAAIPPAGKANGAVFIVCPGGGYEHLADHEGMPIARWLNSDGITAFVLKYRLGPKYNYPAETDDAQRAIRLVRYNAKAWGLDPNRLGILGFSAGGHLASTTVTHFDSGKADAGDPIDRVSSRPDLGILGYPVICMMGPYVHEGSRQNLLGEHPDTKLEEYFSSERQVTPQTPPCFIVATADDHGVPVENSLLFAMACKKNNVPFEMHIFERGKHGFGLGGDDPELHTWPAIADRWLARHGYTNRR